MIGVIYRSAPRRIGEHEWRILVLPNPYRDQRKDGYRWVVDYEWRRPPDTYWRDARSWPRYDWNRTDSGLPKSLRKLHADTATERAEAIAEAERKAAA